MPDSIHSCYGANNFKVSNNVSSLVNTSFLRQRGLCFNIFNSLLFCCSVGDLKGHSVGNGLQVVMVGGKVKRRFGGCSYTDSRLNSTISSFVNTHKRFGKGTAPLVGTCIRGLKFRCLATSGGRSFLGICRQFVGPSVASGPVLFRVGMSSRSRDVTRRLTAAVAAGDGFVGATGTIVSEPRLIRIGGIVGGLGGGWCCCSWRECTSCGFKMCGHGTPYIVCIVLRSIGFKKKWFMEVLVSNLDVGTGGSKKLVNLSNLW